MRKHREALMPTSPSDWTEAMGRAFAELDRYADRQTVSPASLRLVWQRGPQSVVLEFHNYQYEASVQLEIATNGVKLSTSDPKKTLERWSAAGASIEHLA